MKTSKRKHSLIAGWSLILMAVTAGYAYGYVHGTLILPDNLTATLNNLQENTALFGSGVMAWLLILTTDLMVAWSLYRFFQSTAPATSIITGIIRAIYSGILAFAIYHLIWVWQNVAAINAQELTDFLSSFEEYWSLGLIIFGLHLIGLGYLSLKSKIVPKWIGWLLYVAGISYTAMNGAKAILPDSADTIALAEMIMGAPMALAELGLAVWLIWKGGKNQ